MNRLSISFDIGNIWKIHIRYLVTFYVWSTFRSGLNSDCSKSNGESNQIKSKKVQLFSLSNHLSVRHLTRRRHHKRPFCVQKLWPLVKWHYNSIQLDPAVNGNQFVQNFCMNTIIISPQWQIFSREMEIIFNTHYTCLICMQDVVHSLEFCIVADFFSFL